ncbi:MULTISPECIES: response regulator transcription factor [unclassified Rhizobium]|uniref:response regulator transcription factor n=1 Tax=unclassified Rhizobium TaxID=2613769 RepID=UPI0007E924B0|nr:MULTISPECIES: response regulator [unclassified Rhizobium]ANM14468.1 response regulator nodulation protein fixJ 2 [Rhizobium sp. N324]ANM20853.1 response regulator nodulation protein fixJ 2 [Rhizobium sp. N541]ANM27232.1 response regulator nodulation protein fixJ 2 [Rhizobium sp. N941]OWV85842.1 LuxR family transcriptional regulator [Rhizobium sp. N122]OYC99569.1 response regulator nodulation protein fixJ 2 [Rhizobium sp. N4311]
MNKYRVYLVEDDEAVREAIAFLLSTYGIAVEAFGDPRTFLAHICEEKPGCLVVDLRMPMVSGLQLHAQMTGRGIDWPTIMITGHGDVVACRRAFKAGVEDFLTKPIDSEVLIVALQQAFARLDARQERREARLQLAQLTDRERQVFDMVVGGWASKEIAAALGVSARTIDAHRAKIAEKLGTSSVAEFVRLTLAGEGHGR